MIEAGLVHVVQRQLDIGIDCIGDGEFWKSRSFAYYGRHLTGIETRPLKPGETASTRSFTRERDEFAGFYKDLDGTGTIFHVPGEKPMPPERVRMIATGPVKSKGTAAALAQEIETFKAAVAKAGRPVDETFFCVIAPGWLDHFIYNEYYKTDEEYIFALAEALREEYLAIVNAGFVLQIDDPGVVDWWDMLKPALSVEDYVNKFARMRIEAVNHAHQGHPGRPRALSPVLGLMAWAAHPRSAVRARHQPDDAGQRAEPIRSRPPTCATSTNGRCGRTPSCPTARSSCRASSATPPIWSSIRNWSPPASSVSPAASGGRT